LKKYSPGASPFQKENQQEKQDYGGIGAYFSSKSKCSQDHPIENVAATY